MLDGRRQTLHQSQIGWATMTYRPPALDLPDLRDDATHGRQRPVEPGRRMLNAAALADERRRVV
jgi:hypothetical protein